MSETREQSAQGRQMEQAGELPPQTISTKQNKSRCQRRQNSPSHTNKQTVNIQRFRLPLQIYSQITARRHSGPNTENQHTTTYPFSVFDGDLALRARAEPVFDHLPVAVDVQHVAAGQHLASAARRVDILQTHAAVGPAGALQTLSAPEGRSHGGRDRPAPFRHCRHQRGGHTAPATGRRGVGSRGLDAGRRGTGAAPRSAHSFLA